jgi:hypothetical protein
LTRRSSSLHPVEHEVARIAPDRTTAATFQRVMGQIIDRTNEDATFAPE